MKTVRKCFLAMLSTVSIVVATSSVQAQSSNGGQSLYQAEAPNLQPGNQATPVPAVVEDASPRSSAFAVDGNLPFNPIRQQPPTGGDGRPPVVRAPQHAPAPALGSSQNIGMAQFPEVTPAFVVPSQGLGQQQAPVQQVPLPAAQLAGNGPPLAYMPANGMMPNQMYGVAPASYPQTTQYGQPQMGYGQPMMAGPGAYGQMPQMSPYPNPGMGHPGQPQPMPAGYGQPQAFPPGAGGIAGPAGQPGGQSFCGGCGGAGCANCGGSGGGFMAGALRFLLPYAEGGQCAPRWYDIGMDAMYLSREDTSRRVDFTADGPGPNPNIVMSTDDLAFEEQLGVRFNAAVQVLATATAEFTYYGLFSWTSTDSRSDPLGGLYSPISQFGTFPPNGFPQTDDAIFHSISYSSSFDNFEMNFRRRWTAPNCRVQASVLAGVRYFYLLEDFTYFTEGSDTDLVTPGNQAGTMNYNIRARNSLTGFQLGADLWSSIIPGIKAGGELKGGVFGNYGNQTTVIDVTEPANQFNENADANDIAFVADANLMVIWRVNPNWTIRAGYSLLYVDGLLLAPEQFNSSAPPNLVSPSLRTMGTNDNGRAFYHGGFAGLEWQW